MKKVLIVLIAVLAFAGCQKVAEAHTINNITNVTADDPHTVAGLKVDAPNLVKISKSWNLGVEGGKNVLKDVFHNDSRDYFEADKGYFAFLKVTYNGCLLRCEEE